MTTAPQRPTGIALMHTVAVQRWLIDIQWSRQHTSPADPGDSALPDAQLMLRYQSGDSDAFRTLYMRHCGRLHRFIARLAASPGEAEELFQEVWLAVIRDRARYTPKAKFVTYLFTIAHQRSIDRWRFHRRVLEEPLPGHDSDLTQFIGEPHQEPDGFAQTLENAQALLAEIANLPLLQREAFLMQADGGMTVEEIALATGTRRETAKSRLRYANRRLRNALEGRR